MAKAFASVLTASVTALSLILGACQSVPDANANYDYTSPVPESEAQTDQWFDDACIIGHSLMEGFEMFAKVDSNIHYFTSTGLSAAGTLGYKSFKLPGGGTGTLETGLGQKQFSKVYIMLGINEISSSSNSFKTSMGNIVDKVRQVQGEDVPIYIVNVTPTTRNKSNSSAFNLSNVTRINAALQELCGEKQCYYVDLYSCLADDEGYLPSEKSTDGVHLKGDQYKVMADYFKSHTVTE